MSINTGRREDADPMVLQTCHMMSNTQSYARRTLAAPIHQPDIVQIFRHRILRTSYRMIFNWPTHINKNAKYANIKQLQQHRQIRLKTKVIFFWNNK
jgi:hypothetical protein